MAGPAQELRELNDAALIQLVAQKRQELFNLRFQNATGQLDNTSQLNSVRRDIARTETLLREREIAAHEAASTEETP